MHKQIAAPLRADRGHASTARATESFRQLKRKRKRTLTVPPLKGTSPHETVKIERRHLCRK